MHHSKFTFYFLRLPAYLLTYLECGGGADEHRSMFVEDMLKSLVA